MARHALPAHRPRRFGMTLEHALAHRLQLPRTDDVLVAGVAG